jgi:phosphoglycerate dehydrogenase-like enzyme
MQMPTTRIVIFEQAFQRLRNQLAAYGEALEPVIVTADRRLFRGGRELALGDVQADVIWAVFEVFGGLSGRAYFAQLVAAARPRWVHSAAAGYDDPAFRRVVESGATLTTSHSMAIGMSEFVLASVLDHFQMGPVRRAAQLDHVWRRVPYRELMNTTWLILGFGSIGQCVATRARAFGARILGVRREQAPHPLADEIAPLADVPRLLPEADVVVTCIPLRAETRHLANADFFRLMKQGSVFVNVSRGGAVDERALLAALDEGKPAHAILDVFEVEPLPPDHPFWSHPHIVVTPHSSPMSDGQQARSDTLFLENLRRFMTGEGLLNVAAPADVLAA